MAGWALLTQWVLLPAAILLVHTDPEFSPPNSSPRDSYVGGRRWELWFDGWEGRWGGEKRASP